MTGVTSVPLPAYWSSKYPDQWRRYPWKGLACANPRCAAHNANYALVFSEPPAKKRSCARKSSSRSRSVSAASIPNTPVESERNSKNEHVVRCSDCSAPVVRLAQSVSRSTTLTPPTPVQVRTGAHGLFPAGLKRNHRIPPLSGHVTPHFHAGSTNSRAPPPSLCSDYSCEEGGPSCWEVFRLSADLSEEYAREQDPRPPCSFDQASTGGAVTESASPAPPPPGSVDKNHEAEDVLPNFIGISCKTTTVELQERAPASQIREDVIRLAQFEGNDVGSESSASPVASQKGLDLTCDVRRMFDGNRVSSFYNVLYIPDGNTSDDQKVVVDMRRSPASLWLRLALEIAVFSTFVTVLILVWYPSFLSGLKNNLLTCCSCTCSTAAIAGATTPGPHFGQLQWFERWAYRGASSVLGCRSPGPAVGSTVLM